MSMRLMVQAMNCKVGNPARKLVLLKLADNANDDGICFPSYQYIADKCEMSRRSAINHIEDLIRMGLVSKKERKNKDGSISNLYFLQLEQYSENSALGGENISLPSENSALGGENISLPSENSALGGGENSAPITSHSINLSNNHNNPLPLSGESASAEGEPSPLGENKKISKAPSINYSEIAQAYNDCIHSTGVNLPLVADPSNLSDKRKRSVKKLSAVMLKRFGDGSVDAFRDYFDDFMMTAPLFYFGGNNRNWRADFEYLLRVETLDKTLERAL